MQGPEKYAEVLCDWLLELGYTHCFFVAGGNIMHMLDGVRKRFTCVAVVHEVAAGIAAEYFNESRGSGRAFVLVTAGPGLTNAVTAIADAWLESRELLIIGGQAKSADLATGGIRQRGLQEIDGRAIAAPICVSSVRVEEPISRRRFYELVLSARRDRPGPSFIELCLDAQGAPVDRALLEAEPVDSRAGVSYAAIAASRGAAGPIREALAGAARPVLLLGGGVSRGTAREVNESLARLGIPIMTTWNGSDRFDSRDPMYFGRPNTWGQRYANILINQADCIVALGTRLGMQQTGFNWQEFGRTATVVQVDVDQAELTKGHPRVDIAVAGDADTMLRELVVGSYPAYVDWVAFCNEVKTLVPLDDPQNETRPGYLSPYAFYLELSAAMTSGDIVVPCSSGGANSTAMQTVEQKFGQVMITDKGLASMGIGLSGAIGAALAHPGRRTVLVEGDGGFIQNLQELATVMVNRLPIKIFIFANEGYGSIRMTQKNYFGGAYLGCDTKTGLGFPNWPKLFDAFDIPLLELDERGLDTPGVRDAFNGCEAHAFIVPIDPEQTYYPKITSRITATGSMESQPLHLMSPPLPQDVASRVFRYLDLEPAAR